MLDRMSDASRIVERLRKADLVERVPCTTDRRAVDVRITQKGLDLLAKIDKLDNNMDMPAERLSEKEAKELSALLEKILDQMA